MSDNGEPPTQMQMDYLEYLIKKLREYGVQPESIPKTFGIDPKDPTNTKQTISYLIERLKEQVNQIENQPVQPSPKTAPKPEKQEVKEVKQEKVNTEIEPREQGTGTEPYSFFDALDTDQIVTYMETILDTQFFYSFNKEGKEIYGISYRGTLEVAKALSYKRSSLNGSGGIEVLPDIIISETSESIRAVVRARDKSIDLTVLGTAEQPKYRRICERRENGKCTQYRLEPDPFAYTIAVSKATRNALRQLIPEDAVLQLYQEWKNKRK